MLVSPTKAKTCRHRFAGNESGGVPLDWVALTAGIIVVGLALVWYVLDNGGAVLAGKIAAAPAATTGAPPVMHGPARR
jgi:hypothetical protein